MTEVQSVLLILFVALLSLSILEAQKESPTFVLREKFNKYAKKKNKKQVFCQQREEKQSVAFRLT